MTKRLDNKNGLSNGRTNVTDLAAFRKKRQNQSEHQVGKLPKDDSLADYYLGVKDDKKENQFESRLSSIKTTLDKLNILMEKISHLEKRQKL